jgi:hypothetical protein
MGIGVSVFLIAIGAILAFAVNVSARGIDLSTVGVILMIAGGIGLLADLILFGDRWRGPRRGTVVVDPGPDVVEDHIVEDVPPAVRRRRVVRRRDIL